jgi:hypothetical protein
MGNRIVVKGGASKELTSQSLIFEFLILTNFNLFRSCFVKSNFKIEWTGWEDILFFWENLLTVFIPFRNIRFTCRMFHLNIFEFWFDFLKAFWNDFPSGRMDKKGFVKYYEEIKDENDKTGVLCE